MKYLYPQPDGVYAYPKLEPEKPKEKFIYDVWISSNVLPEKKYYKAFKEWESQGVKVENMIKADDGKYWFVSYDEDGVPEDFPELITPGQPCELEGNKVTKLL